MRFEKLAWENEDVGRLAGKMRSVLKCSEENEMGFEMFGEK